MTIQELSENKIVAWPAGEAGAHLIGRTDDAAASINNPGSVQSIVKTLEQHAKSGTASGVSIDYDAQGDVAAITINNDSLYSSGPASVPDRLGSGQSFGGSKDSELFTILIGPPSQSAA